MIKKQVEKRLILRSLIKKVESFHMIVENKLRK